MFPPLARLRPLAGSFVSLGLSLLVGCASAGGPRAGVGDASVVPEIGSGAGGGGAASGMRVAGDGPGLCEDGKAYVVSLDPKLPRVRYLDGQVSLSDSCAVKLGNRLSRKVPPAYVNGMPIGFC